ncbi:hypothetical protein DOK67_0002811 [Enterococcus sp. DIV0212c]|uniref:phage integrase SAM-like domain-containing protein n=1 Tax=Enterococcus sp. DIV0212c TaxID=2230867 RepID=UPI00325A550E
MWIESLPNGNFKYFERYKDPYTDKLKKVSLTLTSKSRVAQKEAQSILDQKISNKLNTAALSDHTITFKFLIDEWSKIYKQQVRESTYLSTMDLLNGVKDKIGNDTLVNKIDTILINNTLEDFLYGERNLSNKYVSIIKSKLKIIFRYATKKGYITNNPVDKVEIQYKRDQSSSKIRDKFLETEEYDEIIAISMYHNRRYGLLFQWLYLTGMRAGEALALTKDDVVINYQENLFTANVNGTMQYRGRKVSDQIRRN